MALTDQDYIDAIKEHGTQRKAADALGVNRRTLERRMNRMARKGYSPQHDMTHTVPDGFKVKGVSSLYNKDGVLSAQWVKSSEDRERQYELMQEAVAALTEEVPKQKPIAAPASSVGDLLNCYVITDYHFGQLSW